jgi:membrane protein DedA with SNARE-associated domain
MTKLTNAIIGLVEGHGLLAVFILMTVESCGLPVPSEVVMPLGGFLAASGHLSLPAAILAGAGGNLLGSLIAYWLAARFGRELLLGPGRWVGFSRAHLEHAERWFDRFGLLAVFLGRLMPVVRTYISFPAGLTRVPLGWFCVLTFVGALPWSAALALVGYVLRENWERIAGPYTAVSVVFALLLLGALVLWFLHGRRGRAAREGVE